MKGERCIPGRFQGGCGPVLLSLAVFWSAVGLVLLRCFR